MKLVTLFWLELYKQKKGWIWLFLLIIPSKDDVGDVFRFQHPL